MFCSETVLKSLTCILDDLSITFEYISITKAEKLPWQMDQGHYQFTNISIFPFAEVPVLSMAYIINIIINCSSICQRVM